MLCCWLLAAGCWLLAAGSELLCGLLLPPLNWHRGLYLQGMGAGASWVMEATATPPCRWQWLAA